MKGKRNQIIVMLYQNMEKHEADETLKLIDEYSTMLVKNNAVLPHVSQQRELLLAWERWKIEKGNYPEYRTQEQMLNDYLSQ